MNALAGWSSTLLLAGAPLAVLAAIAYVEVSGRWPRRAVGGLLVLSAVATLAGLFALLTTPA